MSDVCDRKLHDPRLAMAPYCKVTYHTMALERGIDMSGMVVPYHDIP